MRVMVTGGRDYADREALGHVLSDLHADRGITIVVEGGCPTGADRFAREWASANGVTWETHRADWATHGRAAGPKRNAFMVHLGADLVVATAGGRGTADCVRRAKAAGIPVREVGS